MTKQTDGDNARRRLKEDLLRVIEARNKSAREVHYSLAEGYRARTENPALAQHTGQQDAGKPLT